jgi:hypothetical protein
MPAIDRDGAAAVGVDKLGLGFAMYRRHDLGHLCLVLTF